MTDDTAKSVNNDIETNAEAFVTPVSSAKDNSSVTQPMPMNDSRASKNTSKGGKGLSVLAILLSLGALGGSAYNWYDANIQGKLDEASLAVDVAEIGGQISRIGDTVANIKTQQGNVVTQEQLSTRILEANSATDLRFRDVSQSQQNLAASVAKLNSSFERGLNQLVVDEVSQLLKLANNTVLFSANVESATKALKLADLQLKDLASPRYSAVRKKINQEIAMLESVEQIDIESLSVQLKSLADRIPSLKLENDTPTVGDAELSIEVEEQAQGFKATAKKMLNDLIDLVQIQKIDKAPKPLLAPEQRYFLDQNIQLQLAKAELSLVQNRPSIYLDSLTRANTMLTEYFDLRNNSVKEVQSKISELKQVQLGQDLPSISGSYSLLQSIKGGE